MTLDYATAASLTANEFEEFYLPAGICPTSSGKLKVHCDCGEKGTYNSLEATVDGHYSNYHCPACGKQLKLSSRNNNYFYRVAEPDFQTKTIKEIIYYINNLEVLEKESKEQSFEKFANGTLAYPNVELTDLDEFKQKFSATYGYNVNVDYVRTVEAIVKRYLVRNEAKEFAEHLKNNGYTELSDAVEQYAQSKYSYSDAEAKKFKALYGKKGEAFSFPSWLFNYVNASNWNAETLDKIDSERKLIKKHNLEEADYRTYKLLNLHNKDVARFNSLLSHGYDFADLVQYISEKKLDGMTSEYVLSVLRMLVIKSDDTDKDKIFYEQYPVDLIKYYNCFIKYKNHTNHYISNIAYNFSKNHFNNVATYNGITVKPITSEYDLFMAAAIDNQLFCSENTPYLYTISFDSGRGQCLMGIIASNSNLLVKCYRLHCAVANPLVKEALEFMGFTVEL